MVSDAIDRADDIVDKNSRLEGPVCRPFESAIGVAGYPEVLPDEQAISVCQLIEVVGLAEAAPPDADHVDVGISAEPQLIIVALTITVEHHIGHPGAAVKMDSATVDKEVTAGKAVHVC